MNRRWVTTFLFAIIALTSACRGTPSTQEPITPFAIWWSKDADTVTPESAATAAVRDLIGVDPVLSDFMAGDSRSGEIEVLSPDGTVPTVRSLLLMRQLGPADQWSVIGAINPAITIDAPQSRSVRPPGILLVSGSARGFEGLVVVTAHRLGNRPELIDQAMTQAGSLDESRAFRVALDLGQTHTGDVLAITVRGGVGMEDDPGEFSAIPIRIGP
ncbi:MAG: hypothetical protein O3C62_07830 [Actinomycetota bacterium]|nr:hypothetical protein [Actinomycetota bacterium]